MLKEGTKTDTSEYLKVDIIGLKDKSHSLSVLLVCLISQGPSQICQIILNYTKKKKR